MRILIALALTLAALVAAAPSGSAAVAVCSSQLDASDVVFGDEPLATESCTTENLIGYDCDLVLTVTWDGTITRSLRCDPLIYCVTEPCPGGPGSSGSLDPLGVVPCDTDTNPWDGDGVSVSGCKPSTWPPYDCVQDCDGPPDS